MLLTSTIRIAVNRMMTFGPAESRVAMVSAVERTASSWMFPGGNTSVQERFSSGLVANNFKEYLMLFNPYPSKILKVTVQTNGPVGASLLRTKLTLAPLSRVTLAMNALVAPGHHVTSITSTNGTQFVAEQSLYFNGDLGGVAGVGTASP
jgi:hypothetical protein